MVGVADDADEEVIHAPIVFNSVEHFTVTGHVGTRGLSSGKVEPVVAKKYCFASHITESHRYCCG